MKNLFVALCFLCVLASCTVSKNNYNPNKKYSPEQLQKDYEVFRNMLEESHPSLYWYTPRDSVDYYFEIGSGSLKDSLSEYRFRNVLSYVVAQIRCGHTSIRPSKAASRYAERTRGLMFPLNVKAWKDTVLVTSNLSRRDTNVMRGVLLKSIDNKPISLIVDSLFRYISADGYNTTHKYQTISNSGVFRSMYGSIYGLKTRTPVEYIDTAGNLRRSEISLGMQIVDTARIRREREHPTPRKERKKAALQSLRNLRIDTSLNTAFLEVNSFASRNDLRPFFKTSFKKNAQAKH